MKHSSEVIEFIRQNAFGNTSAKLTELTNSKFGLGITNRQIQSIMAKHRIRNGVNTRFKKGDTSPNKYKKWFEFMSLEGQENSRKTTFKKGNLPHNYKPVGTERITKEGYLSVKIADPNKWKLKHRIVYESHYGSIPKGFCVIFADGNTLNFSIENLILITRDELADINKNGRYSKSDPYITKNGVLLKRLKNKIIERRKQDA